jgi:hypothetical protein
MRRYAGLFALEAFLPTIWGFLAVSKGAKHGLSIYLILRSVVAQKTPVSKEVV